MQDDELTANRFKGLEWSDWELSLSKDRPTGSSGFFWCDFKFHEKKNIFLRQGLFDFDTKPAAVYEIGVKFPSPKRKIYPMYFRASLGFRNYKYLEALSIINNPRARKEVQRLLGGNCRIYIRRALIEYTSFDEMRGNTRAISRYLQTFDYAWRHHGKRGHRKLVKHSILLSDDTL